MPLPDLNEIVLFGRVAQAGSFSGAARALGLPKSTVSRKVAALEERLGARLIQRTTRKLRLTDAGRRFFERVQRIAVEVDEAEQAVTELQAAPRGLLRVTAPLGFHMLGAVAAELLRRHRELQVELVNTDRVVDLVDEGFDVAVRAGALADSTLVARPLGVIKRVLVASPGYLQRRRAPRLPADLAAHECVVFGVGAAPGVWTLHAGDERVEVRVPARLTVNDFEIVGEAARAGLGIAWMPEYLVAGELRRGRLRRVLRDWCSTEVPLHAVYPTARQLSPKVLAFVELARERFRPLFQSR